MDVQTTFGYGRPHYSPTHGMHKFGSTAPVQQDLVLHNPMTGRNTRICGVGIQPGQMTLPQYGVGTNMVPGALGSPI